MADIDNWGMRTHSSEPKILCPNCGRLSPMGTKKCDCGCQLKRSSAPYVMTGVVVALLLMLSVWLIVSAPNAAKTNDSSSLYDGTNSVSKEEFLEHRNEDGDTTEEATKPQQTATPALKPRTPPDNGYIVLPIGGYDDGGQLTIETQGPEIYYIKLRDIHTNSIVLSFFVHGGSSVDVRIPFGEYEMSYACGETWYGYQYLFGKDTSYCKAEDTFVFERNGDSATWWTVELYLQTNGNLSTEPIDPDDF